MSMPLGYGRVGVEEMRQEDCCEFETSLSYRVKIFLKNQSINSVNESD